MVRKTHSGADCAMTWNKEPGSVSVIIPTRGRPELVLQAVSSALAQTTPVFEVVVVVDGPDPRTEEALARLEDPRIRISINASSLGAAGARNEGVRRARGEFVAFLDDDDVWIPQKIECQMREYASALEPDLLVVSCQAYWHTDLGVHVWPTRAPLPGERLGSYLFVRDCAGEGLLATPTIVIPRLLALRHPMPSHLRVHEDLDWLLTLEQSGALFALVLCPLVAVQATGGRDSLSSSGNWEMSLAWALHRKNLLGDRAFSAFVSTEVVRAALLGNATLRSRVAIQAMAAVGDTTPREVLRSLAVQFLPRHARQRIRAARVGRAQP